MVVIKLCYARYVAQEKIEKVFINGVSVEESHISPGACIFQVAIELIVRNGEEAANDTLD